VSLLPPNPFRFKFLEEKAMYACVLVSGEGVGMSGHGMFNFKLTFFEPVKSDVSHLTCTLISSND
jgi:hypothetical protein